ncbi:metallophosphoesterase [Hoeflea prorocentri]|uniref:Metallophosphoesterase n=1 Tax=Hoeflea prorocentri TaxID=1922333 RepID=A0A9X3ZHE1_9HYPH|nr:metallophosphoesterase [Hoeflea prorocentri]MCY6381239.1 metallophosphoesterase [Hoeflea prorocentri]MDA5399039.1 metallophosphoesterase [Hoeflea prorocentri]
MITRRLFLKTLAGGAILAGSMGGYAFGMEPRFRLVQKHYAVRTPRLSALADKTGRPLRIAMLADLHACEPWMPEARIKHIVRRTNALDPDVVVLLGDFVAALWRFKIRDVPMATWSRALGGLDAPLGTYAVLGNHDWWVDGPAVERHLTQAGIPVLENQALPIDLPQGGRFWLAGLGDQLAVPLGRGRFRGRDDLEATLSQISDETDPAILLAHEPDVFPQVSSRFDLTLSGHTHGGQVRLPVFGSPIVPSRYGQRYAYGHIEEDGRQIIVSGGLGVSVLPVRFGMPPEITVIEAG